MTTDLHFGEGKPTFENPIVVEYEEYQTFTNSNYGVCLDCGNLNESFHEPDAENYPCEACGEKKSMGLEQAMVAGYVFVQFDDDEPKPKDKPDDESKPRGDFYLTKRELRAVLDFTSNDEARVNLMAPAFVRAWGDRWLMATDGHALVALKLPLDFEPEHYNEPIPALDVAYRSMGRKKGEQVCIEHTLAVLTSKAGKLAHVSEGMSFPDASHLGHVQPGDKEPAAPVMFSGRLLARLGAVQKAMDEDEEGPADGFTTYPVKGSWGPVEFQSDSGRWVVLVMPMRSGKSPPSRTGGQR